MAYAADSRYPGYLGPQTTPPSDGAIDDIIHEVITGVTDMPPDLVRPKWQVEPGNMPDYDTDWVAFGSNTKEADWDAQIKHVDDGADGYDELRRTERWEYNCIFYGPNCDFFSSLLRDGLSIEQNRAWLRRYDMAVVEVQAVSLSPELVNQRWVARGDVNVIFRRAITRRYNVLNLRSVKGTVTSDTGVEEPFRAGPVTLWDDPQTAWDQSPVSQTRWDVP